MTNREMLHAEIENLPEKDLELLLGMVRGLTAVRERGSREGGGLLTRLSRVTIDAPEDFAENLDQYVSGEKQLHHDQGVR